MRESEHRPAGTRRLNYATVMSTLAVFGVLGGGAWAAATIGASDIKDNAVRSRHIQDGQVLGADIGTGAVSSADIGDGVVSSVDVRNESVSTADVKNGQISRADLNLPNVSSSFGSGMYFGQARNFPSSSPGGAVSGSVPVNGVIDFGGSPEDEGGVRILLAPTALRVRDLTLRSANPVSRPTELRVEESDAEQELFSCQIPVGEQTCAAAGPSPVIPAGSRFNLKIAVLTGPDAAPSESFDYALRIAPA